MTLKAVSENLHSTMKSLSQVILGKQLQIKLSLTCILARGHLLIEDLPGTGKTTLAQALASVLGLDFRPSINAHALAAFRHMTPARGDKPC